MPILYLSRYINHNKSEYYELLQNVRTQRNQKSWEAWILFILKGVEISSDETIQFVRSISDLMMRFKHQIRDNRPKIYSQDLINNLFRHPYTKIEFVMNELRISRPTAISYLNQLTEEGILTKLKLGRDNYYINEALYNLILNAFHPESREEEEEDTIFTESKVLDDM